MIVSNILKPPFVSEREKRRALLSDDDDTTDSFFDRTDQSRFLSCFSRMLG